MYETFYAVLYHRPVRLGRSCLDLNRGPRRDGMFYLARSSQLDGDIIHYFLSLSACVSLSFCTLHNRTNIK